ncbi:MAG: anti-sigma factor family protein [Actinomycetes bacterium]
MTCKALVELVTDYLEGTLPADLEHEVTVHLADCSGCLRFIAQMQATTRVLGSLPSVELSDETCRELLDAFRRRQGVRGVSDGT